MHRKYSNVENANYIYYLHDSMIFCTYRTIFIRRKCIIDFYKKIDKLQNNGILKCWPI